MCPSLEAENHEEPPEFEWGKKRGIGGKKKDVQFYESFTYDGVDYSLYDCVYMHKQGEPAPYIGKLVKIWENADKSKKIKVQWFFRPSEISNYLKDTKVSENELFFASGEGQGLANLNPLEAIAGKCNVVSVSTDSRNLQPSAEELQMADYVFYRVFDVKSCTISDQMDDAVGGLEVKYVFNRRQSVRSFDVPKLDSSGKDEEINVITYKQIQKLAATNTSQELNNVKPDGNGYPILVKEDENVKEVQVNQGSLLGERFSGVDVNSRRSKEPIATTSSKDKSILGAKNVGSKVSGDKNKVKDIKSPVNQVQVEERVKSARKPGNLDETPSKRAKPNGIKSSSNVKETNDLQSLVVPGKDTANLVTGATSSNAESKSELVKHSVGSGKDVKLAENSTFQDKKLSKTSFPLSKETPRPGHAEDAFGLEKSANLTKNFKGLQGQLPKSNSFKSIEKESAHVKDSVGTEMDKKLAEKESACRERPSTSNGVSPNETTRPLPANVSPNETPKSGSNKGFGGLGHASKFKSSIASIKTPLKTNVDLSKDSVGTEASLKDKDTTLAKDSCNAEGGPAKKAKYDSPLEILEGNKNNTLKKLKEKTWQVESTNSSILATSQGNKAKSRLGQGSTSKNHNEKVGKNSNDSLPKPLEDDDEEIEAQIFEATWRPNVEKNNWIKLPWEQRMKDAHDKGRLVLLQNLDPEYTSEEVEDIIWHAFKENCTARMVQHTAMSSPHSGQAFVIFKTREAVDKVVTKLDDRCLMLPNRRPLVVTSGVSPKFPEKSPFVGHLVIDRARRQIQREMKEAVSTSHYSQNNTIEYEMAMAWCLLQSKSDKWWEKLNQQQGKELNQLRNNITSN